MQAIAEAGAGHRDVRQVANELRRADDPSTARAVLRFVQTLPYHPDPEGIGGDLVRAPCETLRVGGDCDCLMVLCGALDQALELRWRFAWISQPSHALDHVLAQAWCWGRWCWQEVTIPGAELGESTAEAVARLGHARRVTG